MYKFSVVYPKRPGFPLLVRHSIFVAVGIADGFMLSRLSAAACGFATWCEKLRSRKRLLPENGQN